MVFNITEKKKVKPSEKKEICSNLFKEIMTQDQVILD